MANEGATGPDGKKNATIRFETHSSLEKDQYFKGKHPSQQKTDEPPGGPAGATAPADQKKPEPTGPAGATGPKTPEDLMLGKVGEPDWKAKALSLEEQLKALNEKGPANPQITNPKLYKLQVIESQTPEEAPLFHKIAYGTATSEELWKAGFLRDHPQYKEKPEDVQMYLERKHPLLFGDDVDTSTKEYQFAKMDFDLEADRVRQSLQNRFDEIKLPEASYAKEDSAQETNALATAWQPEFAKIKTGFEKLSISVPTTDKEVELVEVEIPVEDQQKYLRAGALMVLSEKLPAGAESLERVQKYIQKQYIADHHIELMQKAMKQSAAKMEKLMLDKTTNPNRIKTPAGSNDGDSNPMEAFIKKVTKS